MNFRLNVQLLWQAIKLSIPFPAVIQNVCADSREFHEGLEVNFICHFNVNIVQPV